MQFNFKLVNNDFRGDNVGVALERLYPVSRARHARLPERMLDHEKQFKRSSLVGPVQVWRKEIPCSLGNPKEAPREHQGRGPKGALLKLPKGIK